MKLVATRQAPWAAPAALPLRLLFMVPFAPRADAAHGGARVIAHLILNLAEQHRIALCYLRASDEPASCGSVRAACEIIEEVALPEWSATPAGRWRQRLQVWRQVLGGKPLWATGRFSPEYGQRVQALAQDWRPNVVQIEYHIMGQYLPALEGCAAPRILVEHEPGSDAAQEALRSRQGWLMPYLNWLAWRGFERSVVRGVQAVVVFTERDRRMVARLGQHTPVFRIPLGAPLPEAPLSPLGSEPPGVVFAGNYLHLPNVEAAARLIDCIFPRVQAQVPQARLFIVGGDPPPRLQRLTNAQVTVTGYVPDVAPYLDRAAVVVAPLRHGGGMRVKVLEALAAGKAIVATPLAIEGLALADGEQIALAETDEQIAQAIIGLLRDPARRVALGRRARDWAQANLCWTEVAKAYDALYHNLL